MELPRDLREALDTAVTGTAGRAAVERLIEVYRTGGPPAGPILATADDAAAYAAYRMPATFAAVRAALAQAHRAVPGFSPMSQLDLGGGTGAAAWAGCAEFDSLADITVIDQAPPVLALGRQLAANAFAAPMRAATWREAPLSELDLAADLVTVAYVIGELPDPVPLLHAAAGAAALVVVVEPGTPAGFERIRTARTQLIEAGLRVVAPCPHQAACPIVAGRDWCHFAARIGRSSVHRRLKGGELSYEDEKFSYVAAGRPELVEAAPRGRVLRRPAQRKGLVQFSLCAADGAIHGEIVSRRHGELYRAARDVEWGDGWPPS